MSKERNAGWGEEEQSLASAVTQITLLSRWSIFTLQCMDFHQSMASYYMTGIFFSIFFILKNINWLGRIQGCTLKPTICGQAASKVIEKVISVSDKGKENTNSFPFNITFMRKSY